MKEGELFDFFYRGDAVFESVGDGGNRAVRVRHGRIRFTLCDDFAVRGDKLNGVLAIGRFEDNERVLVCAFALNRLDSVECVRLLRITFGRKNDFAIARAKPEIPATQACR